MSTVTRPMFTDDDMQRAHAEWGANCGPGAIAAINGLTLSDLRPFMGDFERKGYTNPTLMFEVLSRIGARIRARDTATRRSAHVVGWPYYGLARIQWEGPWTEPGVPMRARYRHTHWVGAARLDRSVGIFDVNCMSNGTGWVSLGDWVAEVVPFLLAECEPGANGRWHITHAIEIDRSLPGDFRRAGDIVGDASGTSGE